MKDVFYTDGPWAKGAVNYYFDEQKRSVTRANHFKVYDYPANWQELVMFRDWQNDNLDLCGFVEIDNYLTTTVY